MTNFNGTVLVVTSTENASAIAERIATSYYQDSEYHYKVTTSTPVGLPSDLHDQVSAKLRDSPEGSSVITVYPFANTTSE